MTDQAPDLKTIFDDLFPELPLEKRVNLLEGRLRRSRERLEQLVREEREARWKLEKRVKFTEDLMNWLLPILVLVAAIYGGTMLREYWKTGDSWGIFAVIVISLVVWLSLRDITNRGPK